MTISPAICFKQDIFKRARRMRRARILLCIKRTIQGAADCFCRPPRTVCSTEDALSARIPGKGAIIAIMNAAVDITAKIGPTFGPDGTDKCCEAMQRRASTPQITYIAAPQRELLKSAAFSPAPAC